MSEKKELGMRDWLGIGLFAVGAYGAVLMCMAMAAPPANPGLSWRVAAVWVATIGLFPSLVWNTTVLFLGQRLFLRGISAGLERHLIGVTGLALALAVLLGAFSSAAGGVVGQHTGAFITANSHVAVAALVGLIALFAAVWFAWLRPSSVGTVEVDTRAEPVADAVAKPMAKAVTRPALHKTTAVDEGVTPAESAALFPAPREEPVVVRKLATDEVERAPIPPSPYPEDVRRKGQVPPGAKPLESLDARAETPKPAASAGAYRWTAPRADEVAATADVAPIEPEIRRPFELDAQAIVTEEDDVRTSLAPAAPVLPSPSWESEQPLLFRPEEGDEEPVDAYGTPLTLVEKLRQAQALTRASAFAESSESLATSSVVADELEEADLFDDDDDDGEDEVDEVDDAVAVVEAEAEADVDALDDELEPAPAIAASALVSESLAAQAVGEEDFEESDDLDDEEFGGEEFEDDLEVAAVGADDFEENELEDVELIATDASPALEPLVVPAILAEPVAPDPPRHSVPEVVSRPAAAARIEKQQTGLFDAVETPSRAAPAASTEREVVLQPQAAERPSKSASPAPSAGPAGDPRSKVLTEIGCLFIERGRVAVSMLQRQYEMDFDDACKVLDDLQEMGLIGPYLGGQRRDILLTREQWLERVSQASAAR